MTWTTTGGVTKPSLLKMKKFNNPPPTQEGGNRTNNFINPNNYVDTPEDEVVNIEDPKVAFTTPQSVRYAIDSFGDIKAPGPDGIMPVVLKHIGPTTLLRITNLFKALALLGTVPTLWYESRVVLLANAGKDNYSKPKLFRPIILMVFLFKTYEKVWLWHIEATTMVDRPLCIYQHGFRRGYSTETCVTTMIQRVEYSVIKDDYV